VIAAYVAMFWLTGHLTRPLTSLSFAARAIAAGSEPRIPQIADPDVQRLAATMTAMNRVVTEREHQLRLRAAELERANQSQERLLRIISRLHSSRSALGPVLEDGEIASIILQEATAALQAEFGLVALLADDGQGLTFPATHGYGEQFVAMLGKFPDFSATPLQDVIDRGDPIYFQNSREFTDRYPSVSALKSEARSEAAAIVPLIAADKVLGILSVAFREEKSFSQDERDLVKAFADQGAQALHRSHLFVSERRIRDELQEANRAKDEFLGILGHELRTPVTSILGSARLLARRGGSLPDDAKADLVEMLDGESTRLVGLIENLLLIARIDLGKMAEPTQFSLRNALEEVVEHVLRQAPGRSINLSISADRGTEVISQQTSIEQLVENLLTNAVKYSPAPEPIDLDVSVTDTKLEVLCMDRGPGVEPGELERMFESFYRSPNALTSLGKGLGLTVCRRLVENLGGEIWARLRDGGGLEVGFSVPIVVVPRNSELSTQAT
jgi:signal transduction histidine kinase